MPAPFAFPGHYWDEARGKFFKIEATGTAPEGAAWSQEQVHFQQAREKYVEQRRRRHEDSEGRLHGRRGKWSKRQKGRRIEESKRGESTRESFTRQTPDAIYDFLARHSTGDDEVDDAVYVEEKKRLFIRDPLFAHEAAVTGLPYSATASDGRPFGQTHATTAASIFARELQFKGAVPVLNEASGMLIEVDNFNRLTQHAWATLGTNPERRMARPFSAAIGQPPVLAATKIRAMYVHGNEQPPGLGIVYTDYSTGNNSTIKGQYVMVDENESVVSSWPTRFPFGRYAAHERTCPEGIRATGITTIGFHEASQNLIVTSCTPHLQWEAQAPVLQFFKPDIRDETSLSDDVTWQLGPDGLPNIITPTRSLPLNTNKPVFKIFGKRTVDSVYACSPSPQGHDALCLVGTGDGLRAIDIETVTRLTDVNVRYFIPHPTNHNDRVHIPIDGDDIRCFPPNGLFMHRQRLLGTVTSSQRRPERVQPSLITCVDFVNNHPRLAVAGGRNPVPWLVDLREPSWRPFGTNANALGNSPNAVAHIRSVGEYHVVAAGLWNAMVMYDLRYLKTPRSSSGRTSLIDGKRAGSPAAEPLFRFSDYYNHGRLMGIGFDVDTDLGIVAAAEDHQSTAAGLQGGMGLFSLWNGERLHAPGLWRVQHHPSDIDRVYRPTPDNVNQRLSLVQSISMEETEEARAPFTVVGDSDVHPDTRATWGGDKHTRPHIAALRFSSLPHEGTSLFVGVDARVQKYSIRRGREDVFYGEDEEDKRTT